VAWEARKGLLLWQLRYGCLEQQPCKEPGASCMEAGLLGRLLACQLTGKSEGQGGVHQYVVHTWDMCISIRQSFCYDSVTGIERYHVAMVRGVGFGVLRHT